MLSRLVPHKQIEHALTTLAVLRDHVPDVHLDVVGDGWWMDPLVEYAARLGVSDAVTFHGYLDEESKHQVLQRAWVHLMPSRKEGWGLAVTEAAQHGVPTVGYRSSGGLTDSVTDGITGLCAVIRMSLSGIPRLCWQTTSFVTAWVKRHELAVPTSHGGAARPASRPCSRRQWMGLRSRASSVPNRRLPRRLRFRPDFV